MKKSELKSYIREEIKSTLTVEDTQQDIKDTEGGILFCIACVIGGLTACAVGHYLAKMN